MTIEVDARGLACPQPVILTKKALEENDQVVVMVDNQAAMENVKRMATSQGGEVNVEQKQGDYYLHITRGESCRIDDIKEAATGPVVVAISADRMGRGNDELGYVLIRSFLHTLLDSSPKPDILIFFNTGVKLTVNDSEVLDDLHALEGKGIKILVCGTCLSFFDLKEQLAAGVISNMYDIAEAMLSAGRLVHI